MQADPIVQAPKNSQNLNRYSYVLNNPLGYTDPTGYSFSSFWKKIRPFVAIAVSIWNPGAAIFANQILASAATGFIAGGIATGTVKGAVIGAFTGAAFGAIRTQGWHNVTKSLAAGAIGGLSAELNGGKFGHGFLSAGVGFGMGIQTGGEPSFEKFLVAAIVGGTISELTGGKFANGALMAGFAYAISASVQAHAKDSGRPLTDKEKAEAYKAYGDEIKDYGSVRIYSRKWAFFQGNEYVMAPDGNIYWPAAKGCSDLTSCTLTTGDGLNYETLPTFIHEMGHVMQHQQGINVVLRAFPHQLLRAITFRKYDPYMTRQEFFATPTPLHLNLEAQADWFMHSYCTRSGGC